MPTEHRFVATRSGPILTVALHHPASRNSLDRHTRIELLSLLESVDEDPEVRAIVLTGTDPAFTSGADAKELFGDLSYTPPPVHPATVLRGLTTPTIAAVNGACVSGGLEIALACSMIIASERAVFADTHARLGLMPGWGLTAELPARVGVARARQFSFTGLPVDAATALTWGLVNEVVPHGDLLSRADELGRAVAATDAGALAAVAMLYRRGQDGLLDAARQREQDVLAAWAVDRATARSRFDQSVSPPST